MGDAKVCDVVRSFVGTFRYSIRDASDPQIPDPHGNIRKSRDEAVPIYAGDGGLITAASLAAIQAVIRSAQASASAAHEKSEAAPTQAGDFAADQKP